MRLIDADVIIKALDEALEDARNDGADLMDVLKMELFKNFIKQIISYTPSADAVSVVRCKDCKYYLNSNETCQLIDTRLHFYETNNVWTEDSFCSWGERRENETN